MEAPGASPRALPPGLQARFRRNPDKEAISMWARPPSSRRPARRRTDPETGTTTSTTSAAGRGHGQTEVNRVPGRRSARPVFRKMKRNGAFAEGPRDASARALGMPPSLSLPGRPWPPTARGGGRSNNIRPRSAAQHPNARPLQLPLPACLHCAHSPCPAAASASSCCSARACGVGRPVA